MVSRREEIIFLGKIIPNYLEGAPTKKGTNWK